MLDKALKQILSLMYLYLLLVAYLIHLLLAAIHHLRIGECSGYWRLIGFGQALLRGVNAEMFEVFP